MVKAHKKKYLMVYIFMEIRKKKLINHQGKRDIKYMRSHLEEDIFYLAAKK